MELVIDVPCDVEDTEKDVMVTVVREPSEISTAPVILSLDNTNEVEDTTKIPTPAPCGGATPDENDESQEIVNSEDHEIHLNNIASDVQLPLELSFEESDEEDDEVDILIERRLSERLDDDDQLFSDLLLQFRKYPFLVSRIRKQLAQDLVVSPGDIRRLVKVARDVINVKNKFASSHDVPKPLMRDLFEWKLSSFLSSSWIKPVVSDRKKICINSANIEGHDRVDTKDEQFTNEVHIDFHKQLEFEALCDGFPSRSRQKLSNISRVRRLHSLVRSAYYDNASEFQNVVGKPPMPVRLQVKKTQLTASGELIPAISFDVDSAFQAPCANADKFNHQFSLDDRLEVLRICDIRSLDKILQNRNVKLQSRVAAGPILNTEYDDGKVSLSGEIMPGENLCIIGFAVRARVHNKKVTQRSSSPVILQTHEIAKHEADDYVILNSDLHACLEAIIPSQRQIFERYSNRFDAAFNFSDVNTILSPYRLNFDEVSKSSADTIKSVITRNIFNLLDDLQKSRKAFVTNKITKNQDKTTTVNVLSYNQISQFFQVTSTRSLSEIERYLLVSSMPDHGELYFAMYALGKHYEENETVHQHEVNAKMPPNFTQKFDCEMAKLLLRDVKTFWNQTAFFKSRASADVTSQLVHQKSVAEQNRKAIKAKSFLYRTHTAFALRNSTSTGLSVAAQYQAEISSVDTIEQTYEVFTIPGDTRSQLKTEYTSQEYQRLLTSANNPYPNPSALFTTKPLIEIARSMVIMMNPKKLNFILTDNQLKHAVYDVSRMFDELDDYQTAMRKFFRAHQDEAATDPVQLKRRARAQFILSIGQEYDVKTNVRAAIICARLLVELEAGRHSFKKFFAYGNRGTETLEYSEQNKIQFIVAVAGNSADLGKTGQLIQNYQSDNLKQVADITSVYYDRFRQLHHIQAMYQESQDLALSIKKAQHRSSDRLHGFAYVLQGADTTNNDKTKGLLFRLQAYDIEKHVLETQREKLYGSWKSLTRLQQDVDLAIRFNILSLLFGTQHKLESYLQHHQIDGLYNPARDAENTFCNPAQICCGSIPFDPFGDLGDLRQAGLSLSIFKLSLSPIRTIAILQAGIDLTYGVRTSVPLNARKTDPILSSAKQPMQYRKDYEFNHKSNAVADVERLILEVANAGVHDHDWATHLSRTFIKLADNEVGTNVVSKLQQLHFSLRKFVRLLGQNCVVWTNTYRFNHVANPENGRDAFMYTGDIDMQKYKNTMQQISLQSGSQGLARSSMNYINKATELVFVQAHHKIGTFLVDYKFLNHPDDVNLVQGHRQKGASFSQAQETLLGMLATELLGILHFIENRAKSKSNLDDVMLSAAAFIEGFIQWGITQSELDKPLSAEDKVNVFGRLHDAKPFTKSEELADDIEEMDDEVASAEGEDFDLVDDDTRANIFSQEADDEH